MEKSADAFRTISEVAEDLDLPQHVLRFWETRFPQIRPLKRAGGRRYYRPADVSLLRTIRILLYDEGYTIKGVQRLLKEQGARGIDAALKEQAASPYPPFVTAPTQAGMMPSDAEDFSASAELTADDPGQTEAHMPPGEERSRDLPYRDGSEADALRRTLATLEECERILAALRL
jgi:DNA-binding transcriptional MerR regulator